MQRIPPDDLDQIRYLECWLPLAHEICADEGWQLDAATLQSLVLAARPALAAATNPTHAYVILAYYCRQERS